MVFEKLIDYLIAKSDGELDKVDLVWGLVWGLAGGLVWGLVLGLIWGLVLGLAGGLVWGLVLGLIWGLGSLISVSLIAFFQELFLPIWILIIIWIILGEILFFLDNKKPKKKENRFWFTAKRKGISLLYSIFLFIELGGLYNLSKKALPFLSKHYPTILLWIGYIGIGLISLAVVVGVIFVYIWLYSLKYKKR